MSETTLIANTGSAEARAIDRLESWKAIAAYIRRDIRTVQRWEKQGLPVHRLQHDVQGTVFAYRSEIDSWLRSRETASGQSETVRSSGTSRHVLDHRLWNPGLVLRVAAVSLAGILVFAIGLAILFGWRFWKTPTNRLEVAQRQLTQNASENPLNNVALSRDGKVVAYCDTSGIFIEQVNSGATRLLDSTAGLCPNDWFRDGRKLIANGRDGVWSVALGTGKILKLGDTEGGAAISPDDSKIALVGAMQGKRGIWVGNPDGSSLENVMTTDDNIVAFSWSPTGTRFAYIRSPFFSTDAWLESRDIHGKNITTIAGDARLYSAATDAGLCWLPDGRIVFSLQEPPPNHRDSNVWAIKADPNSGRPTGKPYRITNFNGFAWTNLGVSHDGTRLVALKVRSNVSIYIGALGAKANQPLSVRRLTAENWSYRLGGWAADSSAIVFHSRRLGLYEVYRQRLNEHSAEVLVSGPENYLWPEYVGGGSAILFWASPGEFLDRPLRLMRLSANGGAPQPVLTAAADSSFHCATRKRVCVLRESAAGKATFSNFDPLSGKRTALAEVESTSMDNYSWSLSPDGNSIAYVESPDLHLQAIRLLRLDSGRTGNIPLRGFTPEHISWANNGIDLFISGWAPGEWQLARVRQDGNISVLERNRGVIWFPSPSPDGKKIAFGKEGREINAAVLENF